MTKIAVKFSADRIRALRAIAKDKKLKGREVLDEFTDDDIMQSFNGAGSSAAPEWQRWLLTKILDKKLPAVMIHDMQYRKGGTDEDFHRANEELRDNIKNMDDEGKSKWWNFVADKAHDYSEKNGRPGWGQI